MNKSLRITILILLSTLMIGACGSQNDLETTMGGGSEMMGNGNVMHFHSATVPSKYAGLESPIVSDDESILRGQEIYITHCSSCHGDGGMGDGPVSASLDPAPAPIAHTSQMMGDAYLFWRISEGGSEFGTTMISFKGTLAEADRWDVINYIRALGSNEIMPMEQYGGMVNDPEIQATQQAEMLATAVDQEIITQEEADRFDTLHLLIDEFIHENRAELNNTNLPVMESGLNAMTEQGLITKEAATLFLDIHNRLLEAGLMQ